MSVDQNQKKQLIVLCCLIALVVVLGVYRMSGRKSGPASSEKPKAGPVAVQVVENQPVQSSDAQAADQPSEMIPVTMALGEGRDPFAPQRLPIVKKPGTVVNRVSPPRDFPLITARPIPPMVPFISRASVQSGGDSGFQQSVVAEVDPSRDLKLTGIIQGSIRIAIIHGEDNDRYIVREGQLVDGKYRVQHISNQSVWIKFQSKSFELRLGGNDSSGNRT